MTVEYSELNSTSTSTHSRLGNTGNKEQSDCESQGRRNAVELSSRYGAAIVLMNSQQLRLRVSNPSGARRDLRDPTFL